MEQPARRHVRIQFGTYLSVVAPVHFWSIAGVSFEVHVVPRDLEDSSEVVLDHTTSPRASPGINSKTRLPFLLRDSCHSEVLQVAGSTSCFLLAWLYFADSSHYAHHPSRKLECDSSLESLFKSREGHIPAASVSLHAIHSDVRSRSSIFLSQYLFAERTCCCNCWSFELSYRREKLGSHRHTSSWLLAETKLRPQESTSTKFLVLFLDGVAKDRDIISCAAHKRRRQQCRPRACGSQRIQRSARAKQSINCSLILSAVVNEGSGIARIHLCCKPQCASSPLHLTCQSCLLHKLPKFCLERQRDDECGPRCQWVRRCLHSDAPQPWSALTHSSSLILPEAVCQVSSEAKVYRPLLYRQVESPSHHLRWQLGLLTLGDSMLLSFRHERFLHRTSKHLREDCGLQVGQQNPTANSYMSWAVRPCSGPLHYTVSASLRKKKNIAFRCCCDRRPIPIEASICTAWGPVALPLHWRPLCLGSARHQRAPLFGLFCQCCMMLSTCHDICIAAEVLAKTVSPRAPLLQLCRASTCTTRSCNAVLATPAASASSLRTALDFMPTTCEIASITKMYQSRVSLDPRCHPSVAAMQVLARKPPLCLSVDRIFELRLQRQQFVQILVQSFPLDPLRWDTPPQLLHRQCAPTATQGSCRCWHRWSWARFVLRDYLVVIARCLMSNRSRIAEHPHTFLRCHTGAAESEHRWGTRWWPWDHDWGTWVFTELVMVLIHTLFWQRVGQQQIAVDAAQCNAS